MNTPEQDAALVAILDHNPDAVAAWIDHATNPPTLVIKTTNTTDHSSVHAWLHHMPLPRALYHDGKPIPYKLQPAKPLHTLVAHTRNPVPTNAHQACQNEPIQLGCQIQPAGANWVGTAGLPVKWLDPSGRPRWGLLSNWHVLCTPGAKKGHPQHQPTQAAPACAQLADWNSVHKDGLNYLDAAVADSFIAGKHTTSNQILGIGTPGQRPIDAKPGMGVIKSGRTTQVTRADCVAVGAAVKVGYDGFIATFADQDVFEDRDGQFSAPGDSGSAILAADCLCPCAILFAGGGNETIGCPIRYAAERFNLDFKFP